MSKAILACSVVLAGGLLVSGCSSSDADLSPTEQSSSATPAAQIKTAVDVVTGRLDEAGQSEVSAQVTDLIDHYLDAAYLGDFPRSDFSAAFVDFTDGASAKANEDLALLTSVALSAQIDEAEATDRSLSLDILSPKNTPAGVSARWTLDFTTTGSVASTQHVEGMFDLTPVDGAWKVFGYSIKGGPTVPLTATTEVTP
jgi:hypothetical protein